MSNTDDKILEAIEQLRKVKEHSSCSWNYEIVIVLGESVFTKFIAEFAKDVILHYISDPHYTFAGYSILVDRRVGHRNDMAVILRDKFTGKVKKTIKLKNE